MTVTPCPIGILLFRRPKLEPGMLEVTLCFPLLVCNLFTLVPTVVIVVTRVVIHGATRRTRCSRTCNNCGYNQVTDHFNR